MIQDVPSVLFAPKSGWIRLREHADEKTWGFVPVLLLASVIPAISTYIGTAHVGWEMFGSDYNRLLVPNSALTLALMVYVGFLVGIAIMSILTRWVLYRTPGRPSVPVSMTFITFVSLPFMIGGIAAAFPYRVVILTTAVLTAAWAVYLLFRGLPVFMHLKRTDETRFYAACVMAVGILVLVTTAFVCQHIWRATQSSASYLGYPDDERGFELNQGE